MINFKEDSLYKVVVNNEVFIVTGSNVKSFMEDMHEFNVIYIRDIAGNFYSVPANKDTSIIVQELYRIKHIELI